MVANFLNKVGGDISKHAYSGFHDVKKHASNAWESVAEKVSRAWDDTKTYITVNALVNFLSKVNSGISERVYSVLDSLKKWSSNTWESVAGQISSAWNGAKSHISDASARVEAKAANVCFHTQEMISNIGRKVCQSIPVIRLVYDKNGIV